MYSRFVKLFLSGPVYKKIREVKPELLVPGFKSRVDKEYRAIIERTEGIGGVNNNPLEVTLMFAAFPIALYKCAEGNIDDELFKTLVEAVCESKMMKIAASKKDSFSKKSIEGQAKQSLKSQKKEYKNDWVSKFEYKEGSGEFFLTYSECGVCKLAKQEDVFHLVKYMCVMDYPAFDYQGVVLDRTKTLGYEDDCCNFHVMTKQKAEEIGFKKRKDYK